MKRFKRFLSVGLFLVIALSAFHPAVADPPDPPPMPGFGHEYDGNVHVGAVDDGFCILLMMGLGYGLIAISKRSFHAKFRKVSSNWE